MIKGEKDKKQICFEKIINDEEVTKYGEFISSYFAWTGLSKQKTRAEELSKMTQGKFDENKE